MNNTLSIGAFIMYLYQISVLIS